VERIRPALTKAAISGLLAMTIAAALPAVALGTTAEVARAVGAYMSHHATMDIFASPDGSFWTLGYESRAGADTVRPTHPFPLSLRGPALHLCHLDGRGRQIANDIVLTGITELDEVNWAYPIGFRSDGGLYLLCSSELLDPTWDRIAFVDSGRVMAVSSRRLSCGEMDRWRSIVSPSGRLRVFSDGPPRFASYIVAKRDSDFDFVSPCSLRMGEVPGYLYWSYPRAVAPSGQDAFVAAVGRAERGFSLYRIDFESLALRDSGFLNQEDVWQVVNVAVPFRPVLVPSDSGFWLFAPVQDPQDSFLNPDRQAQQMRVYRIGPDLHTRPATRPAADPLRPYSAVKPGAYRFVRLNYLPATPGKGQKVAFEFWAYGSDGHPYYTVNTVALLGKPR
jgi:hypothetical protein